MGKIVNSGSTPISPDPDEQPAKLLPSKIEITVTPEPKTQKQHRANTRAARLAKAKEAQQSQSPPQEKPGFLSKKRRMRKLKLELYRNAEQVKSARRANKSREA
jgi:hypothetical protein